MQQLVAASMRHGAALCVLLEVVQSVLKGSLVVAHFHRSDYRAVLGALSKLLALADYAAWARVNFLESLAASRALHEVLAGAHLAAGREAPRHHGVDARRLHRQGAQERARASHSVLGAARSLRLFASLFLFLFFLLFVLVLRVLPLASAGERVAFRIVASGFAELLLQQHRLYGHWYLHRRAASRGWRGRAHVRIYVVLLEAHCDKFFKHLIRFICAISFRHVRCCVRQADFWGSKWWLLDQYASRIATFQLSKLGVSRGFNRCEWILNGLLFTEYDLIEALLGVDRCL